MSEEHTYKLTTRQHRLLCEALRRQTRFNMRDRKYPLAFAWLGLGTYTTYKPAIDAGLMTYVHKPNPGHAQWWKLTEAGERIVQKWLDSGFTHVDIEGGRFPPHSA